MSDKLPQETQNEEVDLGQLFNAIGKLFERLYLFIVGIFKKLFLGVVWMVFFIKKHIIKLGIAAALGIGIGILQGKTSDPVFKSYITVKQNYDTGEDLYNSVAYYNDLLSQQDSLTLKKILGDSVSTKDILRFDIQPLVSENRKIKNYDTYLKKLDTTIAKTIDYETYEKNLQDYTYEYQQIIIKSKKRENLKNVFDKIVRNINANPYFNEEQNKDLEELKNEELALKEALIKSDSLQSTYKRVLEKTAENKQTADIGISLDKGTQGKTAVEFDLYINDLSLREQLVENIREQADKANILDVVSRKQDSGVIDNKKSLLGFELNAKKYYSIILVGLTFLVLLTLRIMKYLERYKEQLS